MGIKKYGKRIEQKNFKPPKRGVSYQNQWFKWSFKKYDRSDAGWQCFDNSVFIEKVLHKLEDFATQKWQDVKSSSGGKSIGHGTNNHFVTGTELSKAYKDRFEELGYMERYEKVFSLRLQGKHRLIGVVEDTGVFYILWFDENHEALPMKK